MITSVGDLAVFLLPMGNINEVLPAGTGGLPGFLLPMGNINFDGRTRDAAPLVLSTPYGKHKRSCSKRSGGRDPSFYSLWET